MPSNESNQASTGSTVCIDLILGIGSEPRLDQMFGYVQNFLKNIGCGDGLKILDNILQQIKSQNTDYGQVMQLTKTID